MRSNAASSWIIVAALASAPGLAADEPRSDLPVYSERIEVFGERPVVAPVALGERVRIAFGIGELEVEAGEVSEMRAELVLECRKASADRCHRYRRKLRVEPVRTAEGLEVRMGGLSMRALRRIGVTGRVVVPRWSPLELDVGIGEIALSAGEEDVSVRMGIGEVTVRASAEHFGAVAIRTRIGDAGIVLPGAHLEGRRKMLVGASSQWSEGPGESRIDVRLRIGEATVRLK